MTFRVGRGQLIRAVVLSAAAFLLAACGYHVGGQASLRPKETHTIAIAAQDIRYPVRTLELSGRGGLPGVYLAHWIVSDPGKADVVLANMTQSSSTTTRRAALPRDRLQCGYSSSWWITQVRS